MSTRVATGAALTAALALAGSCSSTVPHTGRLEVSSSWLVYDTAGAGKPVVLLQGAQLAKELWDAEFSLLAAERYTVRYDVRGFGASGPEAVPFRHHDDLRLLLDHLGLERVSLVGLSLGGRIALDFALEHPERVTAIVLAGPGISGWQWGGDATWDQINAAVAAGDAQRAALSWLEHPFMAPAMEQPALHGKLRELALANAAVWTREQYERELNPPALERLGELRVPILVLTGSRDVEDIQRIVGLLEDRVGHLERAEAEGAGHVLNLERPDWFQRKVLDFLERAEAQPTVEPVKATAE